MYKKKYGRIRPGAWLTLEMNQTSTPLMLLFGTLMALAGILVRAFVGSPHMTLLALRIAEILPPTWVFCLIWTVSFFTIGCAAGFVLGYKPPECAVDKYKGCMLFVVLAVLELCWYPTFFGGGLLFLSVLESILILCLSILVTTTFARVSKLAGMILLLHDVWLIYALLLNFAVFFRT